MARGHNIIFGLAFRQLLKLQREMQFAMSLHKKFADKQDVSCESGKTIRFDHYEHARRIKSSSHYSALMWKVGGYKGGRRHCEWEGWLEEPEGWEQFVQDVEQAIDGIIDGGLVGPAMRDTEDSAMEEIWKRLHGLDIRGYFLFCEDIDWSFAEFCQANHIEL